MAIAPYALIDSNVVVAMVAEEHLHHDASAVLISNDRNPRFAVAAHSYAEAYSTLTRRGQRIGYRWSAEQAWLALESVAGATILVGLSPSETLDAIRAYSSRGGVGPRLYDKLIGQAAIQNGISRIVTWNVSHLRDLFPSLEVVSPDAIAVG